MCALFIQFGNELFDCVRDAKGVSVEDVRAKMLAPWHARQAELTSHTLPARPPEGTQAANGSGSE